MLKSVSFALMLSGLVYGALATPAHAYLDPGTGSMILQVLLGGMAGLALAGKLYWHRLLVMIGVRSEPPVQREGNEVNGQADR
jgi:hypothetical protein